MNNINYIKVVNSAISKNAPFEESGWNTRFQPYAVCNPPSVFPNGINYVPVFDRVPNEILAKRYEDYNKVHKLHYPEKSYNFEPSVNSMSEQASFINPCTPPNVFPNGVRFSPISDQRPEEIIGIKSYYLYKETMKLRHQI